MSLGECRDIPLAITVVVAEVGRSGGRFPMVCQDELLSVVVRLGSYLLRGDDRSRRRVFLGRPSQRILSDPNLCWTWGLLLRAELEQSSVVSQSQGVDEASSW